MTKIVNLNKARKALARKQKRAKADQNATVFGLSKAEKAQGAKEVDAAKRALDNHKRDT